MPNQTDDPYDLARFVQVQQASYAQALAELRAGKKRSHWSWYILPQLQGLGTSAMAMRYAISGLAEAKAYLAHPVLGARLRECVDAMNTHTGISAREVLGEIDAQKFRSCLTLFALADSADSAFRQALAHYFSGEPDGLTLALLPGQQWIHAKAYPGE